jgi:Prokaryotic cytochrome b561
MILMPITGYLGTGGNTDYFFLFDIESFKGTEFFANQFAKNMTFEEFEEPFDFIHKEVLGKRLLWVLILGHALAALYHHFVKRDRTSEEDDQRRLIDCLAAHVYTNATSAVMLSYRLSWQSGNQPSPNIHEV